MLALRVASAATRRTMSAAASNHVMLLVQGSSGGVSAESLAAVTAAKEVGGKVTAVTMSHSDELASATAAVEGIDAVISIVDSCLEHPTAETLAPTISGLVKTLAASHVVAPSTSQMRDAVPRAAALLDVPAITDVVAVKDPSTFVRPIYAGNALATVSVSGDSVKVITVRGTAFDKAPTTGGAAEITKGDAPVNSTSSQFVSEQMGASERPELGSAGVVISGGRGVGSEENFSVISDLADSFGAAVGASRAAVDAGYAPNELQVGQTGTVVAPELYMAVGISGAIQHVAGMKDSKCIVAINKDAEAPIFEIADYGLVADLNKAVPEITAAVNAAKGN